MFLIQSCNYLHLDDIHVISDDSNDSFSDKTDSDSDFELEINQSKKRKSFDSFTDLNSNQNQQSKFILLHLVNLF